MKTRFLALALFLVLISAPICSFGQSQPPSSETTKQNPKQQPVMDAPSAVKPAATFPAGIKPAAPKPRPAEEEPRQEGDVPQTSTVPPPMPAVKTNRAGTKEDDDGRD